jgi:hypothetical protein
MNILSRTTNRLPWPHGTTDRTVRKGRGRWVATRTLADAPHSGAPRRFSPQVRAQVTAIACSLPKQCQVPLSRWSRAELARRVAQDATLPRISANTVGRRILAERLRLWRNHAWQHMHDPVAFLQRARPVIQLPLLLAFLLCDLVASERKQAVHIMG